MELKDISVEVRQKNLSRVGQVRAEDLDFEIRPYHNDVGDWTLSLPAEHPMVPHLRTPGSGIVVTLKDATFSGPTTSYTRKTTSSDPVGMFEFKGLLDERILAARICYPNPQQEIPLQGTQHPAHDVFYSNCEHAMWHYVNHNIGPGAVVARRHPALTLTPSQGRGRLVRKSVRFDNLLTLLQGLGTYGELGFRVNQVGSGLVFSVYETEDRRSTIRLDVSNGTLSSDEISLEAPTTTHVIVAGQGDLSDRQLRRVTTTASLQSVDTWGIRLEQFLDQRHTDDWDELEAGGTEILLKEGKQNLVVKAIPSDDGSMEFGRDWFLGDMVTIVLEDQEYWDIVSGAVIKVDSNGVRMGVMIGSNETDGRRLRKRVSSLERNGGPHFNLGPGTPHSMTDLLNRIEALEAQLDGLT